MLGKLGKWDDRFGKGKRGKESYVGKRMFWVVKGGGDAG